MTLPNKLPGRVGRAPADMETLLVASKHELWPQLDAYHRKINEVIDCLSGAPTLVSLGEGEQTLSLEGVEFSSKTLVAGDGISITSTDEEVSVEATASLATFRWVIFGSYDGTNAALRYIPLVSNSAEEETSVSANGAGVYPPGAGRLIEISISSEDDEMDETTVGFHLNDSGTPKADVVVDCDLADTRYLFDFSDLDATWEEGDKIHISVDPTGVSDYTLFTAVFETTLS